MKTRNIAGVLALGLVFGLSLGVAAPMARQAAPPAKPEQKSPPKAEPTGGVVKFAVDPVHSSVVFKIAHLGVSNFYGRFNDLSGTYSLSETELSKCEFDFTVKTESVDSRIAKRDGHLKSADFFNVAEYPTISFKSTKVAKKGEKQLSVTGDLSLHGVTRPITIDLNIFTAKQTQQGFKGGLETTFIIKRSDYGMNTYVAEGGLGDEVTLTVAVEAMRE